MKKIMVFGVCLFVALNLVACAKEKRNTSKNVEGQRTAVEIYSIEKGTTEGMVSTEVELNEYYDILEEDSWELVEKIPSSLKPLYYFNVYYEVVEPAFTIDNQPWVSAIRYILHKSDEKYFISILENGLPITYWRIDSSIAENIVSFVQSKQVDKNKNIENIVKNWGIDDFDKEKVFENYNCNKNNLNDTSNYLGAILIQESEEVTYAGIAAVSKYQKIEKIASENGRRLFATEDLNEIVDFMNKESVGKWKQLEGIPEDAEIKYSFVRSAAHKKTLDSTLYEMYRHILYIKGNDYYVDYMFPASLSHENEMDEEHFYFSIPTEVGEYLCNYGAD